MRCAGIIAISFLVPFGPAWPAVSATATNVLILKNAAAKLAAACRAKGGRPGDMRAAITAADLTGDGLDEWFIGDGYRCSDAREEYGASGNGGMPIVIESGQPNGSSRPVFSETVFGFKLERGTGKPTVWATVGGYRCGQTSLPMGANAWSCEVPLRWDPVAKRLQLAPPSAARNVERTD